MTSDPSRQAPSRLQALLHVAGWAVLIWVVWTSARAVLADHHATPWLDDWHTAREAVAWREGEFDLERLFDQHNEHRVAVPKCVFLADHAFVDGTGSLTQAVVVALQVLNTLLLSLLLAPGRSALRWLGTLVACTCMLWSPQVINLTWSIQLSVIGVYAFGTAAIASVLRAAHTTAASARWIVLAAACAAAAAFTRANGVLVGPLTCLAAWLLGCGARSVVALGLAAAAAGGLFFWGYETPATGSDPLASLRELPNVLRFCAGYLGLPVRRLGPDAALALGAVGIVLAGVAGVRLLRHRRALAPRDAALHVLLLFPCATAAVTALGRVRYPPPDWPSRYVTPVMFFWAVLVAVWVRALSQPAAARGVRTIVTAAGLATALAVLLSQQPLGSEDLRTRSAVRRLTALAAWSGVYDEPIAQRVTLDFAPVSHDIALELRTRRWAHWADERAGWTAAPTVAALTQGRILEEPAAGSLERVVSRPAPTAGVLVQGLFRRERSADTPERIVITDATGRVVGHGSPISTTRTWSPSRSPPARGPGAATRASSTSRRVRCAPGGSAAARDASRRSRSRVR